MGEARGQESEGGVVMAARGAETRKCVRCGEDASFECVDCGVPLCSVACGDEHRKYEHPGLWQRIKKRLGMKEFGVG